MKIPNNKEDHKDKIERLEKTFEEQLKRKDNEIEQLRKDNTAIFKASMKQEEKIEQLQAALKKALKQK